MQKGYNHILHTEGPLRVAGSLKMYKHPGFKGSPYVEMFNVYRLIITE